MKKITLFSVLLIVLFAACKKSNTVSYHLTATVDGQAKTFNFNPIATKMTNSGYTFITVTGFSAASLNTETFTLSLHNSITGVKVFQAGTFSDTASAYAISGMYQPSITTQYVAGTGIVAQTLGTSATIANHLKLVITSIDSTSVKGTFSGDCYFNGDPTAGKKTITNGDFYAKFQ